MSAVYNGLTARELEALDLLVEECSEVILAAQKLRRFGKHNRACGSLRSNFEQLSKEVADMLAVIGIAQDEKIVENTDELERLCAEKIAQISPFLRHIQLAPEE